MLALDEAYQTLEQTNFSSEDSEVDSEMIINTYLNDHMVYQSDVIDVKKEPINDSIDVTEVSTIRIECTTDVNHFGYSVVTGTLCARG